jgi:hypothetical protein
MQKGDMTYVISFHKIYFLIKGLMNMLDILLHGIAPLVPTSPATIEENSCHICQDVRNHANDRLHSLTKREKQVLQLIVTGNSNKVTAFLLKIAQRSVKITEQILCARRVRNLNANSFVYILQVSIKA